MTLTKPAHDKPDAPGRDPDMAVRRRAVENGAKGISVFEGVRIVRMVVDEETLALSRCWRARRIKMWWRLVGQVETLLATVRRPLAEPEAG